ncbi:MAG: hypothetical protein Q9179_005494 [Wetmoreana sp. 5 TL-2023]
MTRRFRLRDWNRRHAYYVPDSTVQGLRRAVTSCLRVHPVLRSMIVDHGEDLPLYVVLRPNHRWFDLAISDEYEVDSPDDLNTFRLNDDEKDYAITPGPLCKIMIVYVRNTNGAGLIYFCHLSTLDALSFSLWHEDIDIALRTGKPPNSHADFKSFAERKYKAGPVTAAPSGHPSVLLNSFEVQIHNGLMSTEPQESRMNDKPLTPTLLA